MRYIIEPTDLGNEKKIWNKINRFSREGLINIVEKGDPLEQLKENMRKIAKALELLNEIGIDKSVMEAYIYDKTKVSKIHIRKVLNEQYEFFKKLGLELR